ncbi:MAG: sulfatase-like hydrolase/transferase [Actinomycetota bacterium]
MLRHARGLALLAAMTLIPVVGAPDPAAGQGSRPNVLIILTDDQRAMDTMEHMPETLGWFGQGGTTFTEGFATTPLCCPSRAAIMTGRFNHNNNVRTNNDQALLDHGSTIQRYLSDAGYRTALAGKFLNLWPVEQNPPHFDRWALLRPENSGYYDARFNVDGTVQTEPSYSTDFIRDYVLDLLDEWESNDDRPWFLLVAPYAPHDPADPAVRHAAAVFPPWPGNPGVFEADKSDKPPSVRNASRTYQEAVVDRERQLRTLLAVDEMVDDILQRMEARGEQDTLAFFLSDNGFFWAEHGLRGKNRPYTEAIKVPFLMRWPGRVPAGTGHGSPVANIDLVPTIMEAAGIQPDPQYPLDGRSLLGPGPRKKLLTESWAPNARGPWASTRTPTYQYIEYRDRATGAVRFREYYDLVVDPFQLTNLFRDGTPRNDPWAPALSREVSALQRCVGAACGSLLREPGIPRRCPGAGGKPGQHLVGADARDRINGAPWRQVLCGRRGSDVLRGKGGKDLLLGGPGKDRLVGGPGADVGNGGPGRDICIGGPGKDVFRGCEVRRD